MSKTLSSLLLLLSLFFFSAAYGDNKVPEELSGIDIEAKLGDQVPLDLPLIDQTGAQVTLRKYFHRGRPVILTINYFSCEMLCNLVLNGTVAGINDPALRFSMGTEFDVVTVSIDPTDTPEIAKRRRKMYLDQLSKPASETNWPFLVGSDHSIRELTKAVGFHYRYDEETKQYAHAAGIFILTPTGRVSQVLYGIEFPGRDLRLALTEASLGSIGSPLDKILLWCYHYDSKERRYTPWAMGIVRIGGLMTVIALGIFLTLMWRGERRKGNHE